MSAIDVVRRAWGELAEVNAGLADPDVSPPVARRLTARQAALRDTVQLAAVVSIAESLATLAADLPSAGDAE